MNSGIRFATMAVLAIFTLTLGCSKSSSSSSATPSTNGSTTPPTDGSQSEAELAGSGTFCATDSSLGGTYANTYYLALSSSGTYSYSVFFTDATSCATAQNSGGNNYATYYQNGTYTVGGTAGTPSTATKITYTVTSATLTIRPGTYSSGPAPSLVSWVNAHCSPSPGFSAVADSTENFVGQSCVGSGAYDAVTIPAVGASYQNIGYNSGSTLEIGASSGQDVWRPGGSTFPSAYQSNQYLTW